MERKFNRAGGVAARHHLMAYRLIYVLALFGIFFALLIGSWSFEIPLAIGLVIGGIGILCEINQFSAAHLRKIACVMRELKEFLSDILKSALSKIIIVLQSIRRFDRLMEIPSLVAKPAPSVLLSFRS